MHTGNKTEIILVLHNSKKESKNVQNLLILKGRFVNISAQHRTLTPIKQNPLTSVQLHLA